MGIVRSLTILFLLLTGATGVSAETGCDSLLYTPECLHDNVAFWQTIYQKIPSDKGLLHDQDSFRVIYDTILVGNMAGRARSRAIQRQEKAIEEALRRMAVTDTASWDPVMRRHAAQWGRPLGSEELLAAADRVRFQLGQRDHFIAGLKRSGRYLDQIKEIFASYGLPVQLSYLPHVESSFNYRAYSKVGAAGIWQFMRSTGRLYLKVGYVIDERLDPIKATHAAAKLLRSNYNKLHSWPLAVTAYNHGAGSMQRAVQQTGTTDIAVIMDQYKTRSFQFASKNFYASFLAAYQTAVNYQAFFGEIEMEPPFAYTEYPLPKSYRPSNLAEVFNVPAKVLQEYNLDIRPTIFKTNQYLPKEYVLKLPVAFTALNRDSIVHKIPEKVALEKPPETGYHKVVTGENLERIAALYQVPLKEILNLNNLEQQNCIYPGQMIAIPGKGEVVTAKLEKEKPPVTAMATKPDTAKRIAATAVLPAPVSAVADSGRTAYIPQYLMAEKPAMPVHADSLQNLWGYLYPATLALSLECVRKCEFCEFNADYYDLGFVKTTENGVEIKVQIDETLGHLAEWSGISSSQLRGINGISGGLYLGELIRLPLAEGAAQSFLKARIEYHMSIEEDFFNNYEVTGMDTVQVKSGTNVWNLCQENDIPLWLFLKSNPAINDLRSMRLGAIIMPQVEEKK